MGLDEGSRLLQNYISTSGCKSMYGLIFFFFCVVVVLRNRRFRRFVWHSWHVRLPPSSLPLSLHRERPFLFLVRRCLKRSDSILSSPFPFTPLHSLLNVPRISSHFVFYFYHIFTTGRGRHSLHDPYFPSWLIDRRGYFPTILDVFGLSWRGCCQVWR